MIIRPYKITDLQLVKEGYQKIFDYDYLSRIEVNGQKRYDILEAVGNYVMKDTTNYHIKFFVAEENNSSIGFITFGFDKVLRICTLRGLYIEEKERKKGVGKALMKTMYQKCLEYNMDTIIVSVVDSNSPAIKLYQSEGFGQTGMKFMCKI